MKKIFDSVRLEILNYLLLTSFLYVTILLFLDSFSIEGFNYVGPQLRRISEAMLFSLPVFLIKKRKFLFPYLLLVVLYLLSIIWYYRNYGTLMPLASYLMIYNLNGLGGSIIDSINVKDILLILPTAVYFIVYHFYICPRRTSIRIYVALPLALSLSFIIGMTVFSYKKMSQTEGDKNRFRETPVRGIKQYGIIQYWISQVKAYNPLSSDEIQLATSIANKYVTVSARGHITETSSRQNLIIILVESLCDWPLNRQIEGEEITPCLNALLRDSCCVYLPKVLPQVKDGRSSDAQLLINTGLLPINTGAVSALYSTNYFLSLPKALKQQGYYTASFICDAKDFWSQGTMSESFGFDKLYDNLGVPLNPVKRSDELLFERSFQIIQELPEPFYAQLVTLSMHKPYTEPVEVSCFQNMAFRTEEAKYYSILAHYTDRHIGNFINQLKQCGLYKNTMIVIVGDHDDCTFNKFEGRNECLLPDRFVPLIVLNANKKLLVNNFVIGQVDIYPSLLDLMHVDDYCWKGLGTSFFKQQIGGAVYHNGDCIGQDNDSIISSLSEKWNESDLLIRAHAFANIDVQ